MTISALNHLHWASKPFVRTSPTPTPTRLLVPLLLFQINLMTIRTLNYLHCASVMITKIDVYFLIKVFILFVFPVFSR